MMFFSCLFILVSSRSYFTPPFFSASPHMESGFAWPESGKEDQSCHLGDSALNPELVSHRCLLSSCLLGPRSSCSSFSASWETREGRTASKRSGGMGGGGGVVRASGQQCSWGTPLLTEAGGQAGLRFPLLCAGFGATSHLQVRPRSTRWEQKVACAGAPGRGGWRWRLPRAGANPLRQSFWGSGLV